MHKTALAGINNSIVNKSTIGLYSGAQLIVNIKTHVGITGQCPLVNRVQRHQIRDAGSLSRCWKLALCFIEFKCAALKGSTGTSNKL